MSIAYACAASHAPGMTAWADAAPKQARENIYAAYDRLRRELAAASPDVVVLIFPEHWTNFFLDNMPSFCIGRADSYRGPVEPWLKVPKSEVPGDAAFSNELISACYQAGFEVSCSDELEFDHGAMVPLHFLLPEMDVKVVPLIVNTLVPPFPTAARCFALGAVIGRVAADSTRRVALIATGGLSHWPGEREHGRINPAFDRQFLDDITAGRGETLRDLSDAKIATAGTGGQEVRAWIVLAGATGGWRGEVLAYEEVPAWGTGCGLVQLRPAA